MSFIIGCDLGQFADYTAVSVLDVAGDADPAYALRHLDRWRGKPYTAVTQALAGVLAALPPGSGQPAIAIDQTGVGAAVVDQIRATNLPAQLVPIAIHGGDKVTHDAGTWRVPKRDLVAAVAVAMQGNRLRLAEGLPLLPVLTEELARFKVKINPETAHDSYAAWRENDHDDCVLSVALGIWWGERCRRSRGPIVLNDRDDDWDDGEPVRRARGFASWG